MTDADFSIVFDSAPVPKQEIFLLDDGDSLSAKLRRLCGAADETRLFVTDSNVAELGAVKSFFAERKIEPLALPAGEGHKTIDNALLIVKTALERGMNRTGVFMAVGGGVVTDLTGFAASIFMRGAAWDAVPTTLLGMADAAIGGKTGCDFGGYKNMAGSFFPARHVCIAPEFALTLPESEYRSGLGEAVKTALLFCPALFALFRDQKKRVTGRDPAALSIIARECAKQKAAVVREDFAERGRRALLNFGHTFAHALEARAGLGTVPHGDAVAWGISRALALSVAKGLCAESYRDEVCAVLSSFGWETGPRHPALDAAVTKEDFLAAMKKDKKITGGRIRVVLQKGIADNVITEVPDGEVLDVLF